MRGAKVFIDSTTFLYSRDENEPRKMALAITWIGRLSERQWAQTNLQVVNEVTYVLIRKKWISAKETFIFADEIAEYGDEPLDWAEVEVARKLHERFRYSWWDSLLLASALRFGCSYFLSEDMQDGHRIDIGLRKALTIIDPFAHSPADILSKG